MTKRGISVLLSAFLGLFLLFPASPDALALDSSPTSSNDSDVVTLDESVSYAIAESFIEGIYPTVDVEPSSALPFCDSSGNEIGYIVNLSSAGQPYGYVVLDSTIDSLIAEYSIGDSAVNPAEVAIEHASDLSGVDESTAIIKVSPIEYGVVDADDNTVITNEGVEGSLDEVTDDEASSVRAKDPADWKDAFIRIEKLYRNYTITSSGNLDEFYSINETEIEKRTNHYACLVSAYYAIAGYYGILNVWSDFQEYDAIWNYTGTKVYKRGIDGVLYGSTDIESGADGFVKYLKSKGVTVSRTTTSGKPSFNKFKSSVNSGNPSIVHAWLIQPGKDYPEGHGMFVEGYITAADKSTPTRGVCILQVFDGWGDNVRYLNYDFKNFTKVRGTFFSR